LNAGKPFPAKFCAHHNWDEKSFKHPLVKVKSIYRYSSQRGAVRHAFSAVGGELCDVIAYDWNRNKKFYGDPRKGIKRARLSELNLSGGDKIKRKLIIAKKPPYRNVKSWIYVLTYSGGSHKKYKAGKTVNARACAPKYWDVKSFKNPRVKLFPKVFRYGEYDSVDRMVIDALSICEMMVLPRKLVKKSKKYRFYLKERGILPIR